MQVAPVDSSTSIGKESVTTSPLDFEPEHLESG